MRIALAALIVVLVAGSHAQAQDIFVFDLSTSEGRLSVGNGWNATARKGYDNQPHFAADSASFMFTSLRGALQDVYEVTLASREIRQVTDTPDAPEYSPAPSADGTSFTAVKENTVPDQTVWRVDLASGEATWALTSREPIGYYAFNPRGEALLWVRYAFTIQLARPDVTGTTFITGHAAPSAPKLVPGSNDFTFVHRQVNGESWIKRLDPASLSITPVAPLPVGQIDYAWTPDGVLVAGDGSTLVQWRPGESNEWSAFASLEADGVRDITRLAVSPDGGKIAIVAGDASEE